MVLGVNDAAKRMGVRPERVLKLIHDGRLEAQKVGSRWVIDESALSSRVWIKSPGRPMSAKSAMVLVPRQATFARLMSDALRM
ncbi:MAG: helix-turn-helix domain-containing protein, partial [Specibacter sp.]